MASDAESIREITLSGQIDLFPVRRTDGKDAQRVPRRPLKAVHQRAEVSELTDELLIELVRSENADALDALFSRYSRMVYSIAFRILHDVGEAEEVVQESFLYLFRKAACFEPLRGSAKVWIVQIAYSRARDRKAHLIRRGFYRCGDIEADGISGLSTGEGDIEREVEARVDLNRLHSAFEELTENQRATLRLFYFDDLDLREISEKLCEPLGNVRHYFYRGLERLRKSTSAQRFRNHRNAKV